MNWLPLALLTAALSSLVSITDKIVVERYLRDAWSFPFFTGAFLGLYCAALLVVRGSLGLFHLPSPSVLAIALLPGAFQFISSLFYTRALQKTDASTISALNQTVPLFALLWGWIFFGNVFQLINYAGIFVIVISCVLLGMEQVPGSKRLQLSPAVWLILIGAVLRSLSDLFVKATLSDQDYWNTFGLSRAVLLPITLVTLFYSPYRKSIVHSVHRNGFLVVPGIALLEVLAMTPLLLGVISYSLGPLGPVAAIIYSSPFFVLVFSRLLNFVRPNLVPVRERGPSLARQATLIGGVLLGVIMLRL